jgi:hypothetical protein
MDAITHYLDLEILAVRPSLSRYESSTSRGLALFCRGAVEATNDPDRFKVRGDHRITYTVRRETICDGRVTRWACNCPPRPPARSLRAPAALG